MENKNIVDKYIAGQPKQVRDILENIRGIIREEAPGVIEKMGYGVPEFNLNGPLIYFAGFKNHIGIYPTSSGVKAFEKELLGYKSGKGSIQFPLDKSIPYDLIKKIVSFRVKENLNKSF